MSSNGAIKVNARRVVSCAAPTCSSASTAAVPPAGWMASRTAASTARSTRRPPSVRHAYHSCRNRHCPTCQGGAQAAWLAPRERDFLAVPFCHVVLTLPAALSPLALQKPREACALSDACWKARGPLEGVSRERCAHPA